MSERESFGRKMWAALTGQREPSAVARTDRAPDKVTVHLGDGSEHEAPVRYAGVDDAGVTLYEAVLPWPRHRQFPAGKVDMHVAVVPAHSRLAFRVEYV